MTTETSTAEGFARGRGPLSGAAVVGAVLGVAAGALVWERTLALLCGMAAVGVGLRGVYEVATYGRRGRGLTRIAIGLGALSAVAALVWQAQRDGAIDLTLIGEIFFRARTFDVMWRPMLTEGLVNTIRLAFFSELFGVVLGLVLATMVLAPNPMLRIPAKAYIDVFRGTPLLVQLLVIGFGLPFLGLTFDVLVAGIIGLTLNSAAYVAEVFRAGIQSIERGQRDAARSLGMPETQTMLFVVIPQAVRRVIPPLMNEFIALIKDSSLVVILGFTIGQRELLGVARSGASTFANSTPFVMAAVLYLTLTVPLSRVVDRVERRVRRGLA